MDLRQIMYFAYLYEEGSFTKAAARAGVVQPALSMQIKRLEEQFGEALFDRTSHGIKPTTLGEALYELYAPIRRDLAAAKERALELSRHSKPFGRVRCGFPPTFFKAAIGKVVAAFTAQHANVDLELKEGYGGTLTDWVAAGDLDFALGAWVREVPGLEHPMFFEEDLVLVSGTSLGLPRFAPCDLSQLRSLKLMIPSGSQVLGPIIRQHIKSDLVQPLRTMVVDSYFGVLEIARNSDWCALIPATGLIDEIDRNGLHIHPLAHPTIKFRWHLIHRAEHPLSMAARLLLDDLSDAIRKQHDAWRMRLAEVTLVDKEKV